MRTTIDMTLLCTIEDPFALMEVARQTVRAMKGQDDWETYYPKSPTEALELVAREGMASRLLGLECVTLHEIGHNVRSIDL